MYLIKSFHKDVFGIQYSFTAQGRRNPPCLFLLRPFVAMLACRSRRLRRAAIDCSVAVLMQTLLTWVQMRMSRDVLSLLRDFASQISWKCTPSAEALVPMADLYRLLASIASNGLLPIKKLELAAQCVIYNISHRIKSDFV